jgi:ribonuclease Z
MAGLVCETPHWRVSAEIVEHGTQLDFSDAFRRRWVCLGYRFECDAGVIAISGDTVDCAGLRRLARGADLLVQCCYLSSTELTTEHLKRVARYTLACGDTVGKIATACDVKKLVLTHHRQKPDAELPLLEADVRKDYAGPVVVGGDLMRFEI